MRKRRTCTTCAGRGESPGSAIDFLIFAVAQRWDWHIFTTNRDFECFYGQVLELNLYAVA
jgi:hypothetical protein